MSDRRDAANRDRSGLPPVEPLSELTWARIERSVFAELDASRPATAAAPAPARRWPVWAAGALAAAAAITLWITVGPGLGPDTHAHPARVVTADAPTEVSFGDAVITAAARSTLVLGGTPEGGVLIVVERGGARFDVSPRDGRPPFRVQAGDVSVRVVGTRFVVARDGDTASVEVVEGTVEVVAAGQRVFVEAGDRWSSATGRTTTVEAPAAASDASAEPRVTAPTAPTPPATTEPTPARPPRRASRARAPAPDDDDEDEETGPVEPTSKEQFEAAAHLERTDPASALDRYRALARGSGPWAANALFAAGRLSFDRGDPALARRLLTRYLRRFPRGNNAADSRALLDRL